MHVHLKSCEQSSLRPCMDLEVTFSMYLNVSEMHEWKVIKMSDFMNRLERAITREFSKPLKEKHRVLLFEEE